MNKENLCEAYLDEIVEMRAKSTSELASNPHAKPSWIEEAVYFDTLKNTPTPYEAKEATMDDYQLKDEDNDEDCDDLWSKWKGGAY